LLSWGALAGTPHLVRDINAHVIPVGSYATDFIDFGTTSFFDASDGVHGYEPWTTDGTVAGTFQWGDLNEGPAGATQRQPVRAGAQTYLTNDAPNGAREIWVAGASAQSVRRISTPELSALANLAAVGALGNAFIFSGFNPATGSRELWTSDGTQAGTRSIPAANGDPYTFLNEALVVGSKLYFFSINAGHVLEPWVTDGTQAGTRRLPPISNAAQNPSVPRWTRVGDFALFACETTDSGTELCRIDLRDDTVARVTDLAPGTASALRPGDRMRNVNGVAIFSASPTGDDNMTTWRTDGTGAGTFQLAGVALLFNDESAYLGASDVSRLMFRVAVGTSDVDTWTTDGSVANTALLRHSELGGLQRIGQHYYFTLGQNDQLWTTDGTAASTRMLNGVLTGGARLRELTGDDTAIYVRSTDLGTGLTGSIHRYVLASDAASLLTTWAFTNSGPVQNVFKFTRGRLYFDHEDAVNGRELWTSDGTPAGTQLLINLAPEQQTQDSAPANFVRFNNALYFTADDGDHGRELWRSDGTEAGTSLFFDARPGPTESEPTALFAALNRLFFFARDAAGVYRLWSWDGIASEPEPLVATVPVPNVITATACDSTGVVVNGEVLFQAYDSSGVGPLRLWATNGTAAGTRVVANPGPSTSGTCERAVLGNRLYLQGTGAGGGLWIADGTSATMLLDLATGPIASMPHHLVAHNGKLYFIANDSTSRGRLWSTDGTVAGTTIVDAFGAGVPFAAFGSLNNGFLTFVSELEGSVAVSRAWTTDGTSATRLSSTIRLNGTAAAFVNRGKGYFSASSSTPSGLGPAVTDGTIGGTRLLVDLRPDASRANTYTDFDGITFFQTDNFGGSELWRTDGTSGGTRHVADVFAGSSRLAANHNLFYVAVGATAGAELFAIENSRPVAVNDALGSVQAGSSIAANVLANDTDADGALDASSVAIVTQPTGGSVSVAANGTITYIARGGFAGADSFTYSVADDQAYASSPATVQVTVTAAPSPPAPPPSSGGGGGGGGGGGAIHLLELSLLLLLRLGMVRAAAGRGRPESHGRTTARAR